MVPKHRKLDENEKKEVMKKFNINRDSEVPEISRFDPVANIMFLRPGECAKLLDSIRHRLQISSIGCVFHK